MTGMTPIKIKTPTRLKFDERGKKGVNESGSSYCYLQIYKLYKLPVQVSLRKPQSGLFVSNWLLATRKCDFFTEIYVRNTKLTGSEISNSFLSSASLSSCNIWQSDIMGTHSSLIRIRHKKKQILEGGKGGGGGNFKIECKSSGDPFVCQLLCGYHSTNLQRGDTLSPP